MAGPIINRLRERLDGEEDENERTRLVEQSPILSEQRVRLKEEMKRTGGGCCGAMEAAEALRDDGQKYG